MRILLQRVNYASVKVDGEVKGEIEKGVLLFVGITHNDTEKDAAYLAEKIANLRIFEDDDGKMNRSVLDIGGEALVISQFTLFVYPGNYFYFPATDRYNFAVQIKKI